MNSSPCRCHSEFVRQLSGGLGITALGVAGVETVDRSVMDSYRRWIADGMNGSMAYLDRYHDIRCNPGLLLTGARSIIVAAFNYYPRQFQSPSAPQFAYYAYGLDYHDVVRERLVTLSDRIRTAIGGEFRVCVDTAPLFERYWAEKAGVGIRGLNSQLIIPGKGSYFFLGEILTTLDIVPDLPSCGDCGKCGACVEACPAKAIQGDGTVDARKCLSYLTIEHRGELPSDTPLGNHVYGCDECQKACPHNRHARATDIEAFTPSEALLSLDREKILNMTPADFSAIFRRSAVKRTKLAGLIRNAGHLSDPGDFVTLQSEDASNPHR